MTNTGQPDPHERAELAGIDIVVRLLVAIVLLGGIGLALDLWLGWTPWLMLVGVVSGFGAWIVSVARR